MNRAICVIEVPEGEEKEGRVEKALKEIMAIHLSEWLR